MRIIVYVFLIVCCKDVIAAPPINEKHNTKMEVQKYYPAYNYSAPADNFEPPEKPKDCFVKMVPPDEYGEGSVKSNNEKVFVYSGSLSQDEKDMLSEYVWNFFDKKVEWLGM